MLQRELLESFQIREPDAGLSHTVSAVALPSGRRRRLLGTFVRLPFVGSSVVRSDGDCHHLFPLPIGAAGHCLGECADRRMVVYAMRAKLGIAPIAWSNDDLPGLGGNRPLKTCLSESKSAGFIGVETGGKLPPPARCGPDPGLRSRSHSIRRVLCRTGVPRRGRLHDGGGMRGGMR